MFRRSHLLFSALVVGAISQFSSAASITATNSAGLTSAISAAVPGDTIVVVPSATPYVGTFTLTDKGASTNYITIQSANIASLPAAGRRVVQTDSVNMPKIVTPDGATGSMAIKTSGAAHHWKLIGLEITGMANNASQTIAVQIGANDSTQTSLTQVPHHITFDRCIVRANSGSQPLRRAFALHSRDTEIINCRVADCKDTGSGDSQAVAITNGPGPFLIDNCFLEAASEHILVGGSPVQIVNMVPSNITVTRNHFYKPLTWKGTSWNVKNHFELKAGNNVLVDGNIMENCWHQAGSFKGTSISLKRIAQPDQGNTWTSTDNVTISNNIIRNVGIGISIAGSTEPGWGPGGSGDIIWTQSGWPKNVTIRNNLWHDISGADVWAGNEATFINMGSGGPNTKFDHNTAFVQTTSSGSRIAEIWAGPYTGFEFTNNIVNDGQTFNFRSGLGNGEGTFDNFMGGPAGMVYKKNVTADVTSSLLLPNYHGDWGLAPFSNTALAFPVGFGTVLQNFATPGADYSGWKVLGWNQPTNTATYPYNNTGTDGKDIGCDIDLVNSKTAGCISGVWGPPPPTGNDIVLWASEAPVKAGNWVVTADATAAGGFRIGQPNNGAAKVDVAAANPTNYIELTFQAQANVPYHMWLRGKALANDWNNDSAHVQFNNSVDSNGAAIWRIGTTSSAVAFLEEGSGAGLAEWGWNDNSYDAGGSLGQNVIFSTSGTQTMRIQQREDGYQIDQVVLSPATYLTARPGTTKNDTTILQKTTSSPTNIVLYAHKGTKFGNWVNTADATAAGGQRIGQPNNAQPKVDTAAANPANYFEITFFAHANTPYHMWFRGKALNDDWNNDTAHVQFDNSIASIGGAATWRIGTTSSAVAFLEEGSGAGLAGWGWNDNSYDAGGSLGQNVIFSTTGTQKIRVQQREDGYQIDQIVLSPTTYLTTRPGATKNDTTILAEQQ